MVKVYVGNLRPGIREIELADEFRSFGFVRSVWVARNPPGYAFIEFDKRQDADAAISALDGKHGWRVELSVRSGGARNHSRGSHGSGNRCSECGSSRHSTRDCRLRSSRHIYRRSTSPYSNRRYDISPSRRNRGRSPLKRSRSRSPGRDARHRDRYSSPVIHSSSRSPVQDIADIDSSPVRRNDHNDSLATEHEQNVSQEPEQSPPREVRDCREQSGSPQNSPVNGSIREVRDCSRSPNSEQSNSPQQSTRANRSPGEVDDFKDSPVYDHDTSLEHDQSSPAAERHASDGRSSSRSP